MTADPAGPTESRDLDRRTVESAYAGWAPIYDAVCGPVFAHGRHAAARAARRPGARILEVGVGTGLSFGEHGSDCEIIGIDLSPPMLARARTRLAGGRHPHVKALMVMDAHHLAFGADAFDRVLAQFVITLVADPERVLSECARVLRPGGEIVLVNHFYSERGAWAAIERGLARSVRRFGLRPEFPFARLEAWARAHGAIELVERRPVRPFYTLVRFRKQDPSAAPA